MEGCENPPLEVGDFVIRQDGRHFRSGCSQYEGAVVISLEPFALASIDGDMLWQSTVAPDDVEALCRAPERWRQGAFRRLKDVDSGR